MMPMEKLARSDYHKPNLVKSYRDNMNKRNNNNLQTAFWWPTQSRWSIYLPIVHSINDRISKTYMLIKIINISKKSHCTLGIPELDLLRIILSSIFIITVQDFFCDSAVLKTFHKINVKIEQTLLHGSNSKLMMVQIMPLLTITRDIAKMNFCCSQIIDLKIWNAVVIVRFEKCTNSLV